MGIRHIAKFQQKADTFAALQGSLLPKRIDCIASLSSKEQLKAGNVFAFLASHLFLCLPFKAFTPYNSIR